MADPLQLLLLLDVARVDEEDLIPLLPDKRSERVVLRLSETTGLRPAAPGAMRGPYDWDTLGRGVESLCEQTRRAREKTSACVELYIAGRAPLPLFVHLGYGLSKFFGGEACVLNLYRAGEWKPYPMTPDEAASGEFFFDQITPVPSPPNPASGWVAVFVSTIGAPAPQDALLSALREHNHELAGVVEIRTSEPGELTKDSSRVMANELRRHLPCIQGSFPKAEGIVFFLAGPTPMAFAVGQALNFHAQPSIWVMNYDRGGDDIAPGYELAVTLPFRAARAVTIEETAEAKLSRREVLDAMVEGIDVLRRTLHADDLALDDLASLGPRYLHFLSDLRLPRDPDGTEFHLSIAYRELRFGSGLLEALRPLDLATRSRFAQLLLLHELYHDGQNVRSSNYQGVGRAGLVLEEVDYWADNFALASLCTWDVRQSGPRGQQNVADIATGWIDTAIIGIEAFDRLEFPDHIERLSERRLRRYLIWHLQRERARTVRSRSDLPHLFGDRLFVELAPLEGLLDSRGDKIVRKVQPARAEIFVVRKGRLVRKRAAEGFQPSTLVDAVRAYDRNTIQATLRVVIEEHRELLVPWAEL